MKWEAIAPMLAMAVCMGVFSGCAGRAESSPVVQPREDHLPSGDGVRLFYRTTAPRGDTIVVLHGGPGFDFRYLAPDLEPLAESHTLVFYDQRGAGGSTLVSDSAGLNLEAHLDDLDAVRRHFGLGRLKLLGHSWGAMLAARYALRRPAHVSRLVLASPGPPRRTPYLAQLRPTVTRWMDSTTLVRLGALDSAQRDTSKEARSTCSAFWQLFLPGYFADPGDTATIGRMRGDFCDAPEEAIRNRPVVGSFTWQSLGKWDWRDDFHGIQVPVLVITGTTDIFPTAAAREWEAAFPEARLVLLDGAGHYPQIERPEQFFPAVVEFLHR